MFFDYGIALVYELLLKWDKSNNRNVCISQSILYKVYIGEMPKSSIQFSSHLY